MSNIGDILTFDEVDYELLENNIIPVSKNTKFMLWLSIASIVLFIVLTALTLLFSFKGEHSGSFSIPGAILFLASFVVFVLVHEGLHGLSFMIFGKIKAKNIRYGVMLKSGVAYCISLVPISVWASRLSLMMPIYAVCLPLYIYGLVTQNLALTILSLLYLTGSVGDIYYMWKLRKTPRNLYMYENPPTTHGYEIGYLLFRKK